MVGLLILPIGNVLSLYFVGHWYKLKMDQRKYVA